LPVTSSFGDFVTWRVRHLRQNCLNFAKVLNVTFRPILPQLIITITELRYAALTLTLIAKESLVFLWCLVGPHSAQTIEGVPGACV